MLEREKSKHSITLRTAGNWTTPRLRQLFQHFQTVEQKLGAWLEKDNEGQHQQTKETLQQMHAFQIDHNLTLVKTLVPDLSLSGRNIPALLLENLVPFFDAGFLLRSKDHHQTQLEQFFFRGVVFPLPKEGMVYRHSLPRSGPSAIKKMAASKWLEKSGFSFLQIDPDADAFCFNLFPMYILFLSVPLPVLGVRITSAKLKG